MILKEITKLPTKQQQTDKSATFIDLQLLINIRFPSSFTTQKNPRSSRLNMRCNGLLCR